MVHFVCVGTPQRSGEFAADTSYVDAAVTALLPVLRPGDLVVGKSTVPVGSTRVVERILGREIVFGGFARGVFHVLRAYQNMSGNGSLPDIKQDRHARRLYLY